MSYQKKKSIQEKNILLEKRYIFEQSSTPIMSGNTSVSSSETTNTKITKDELNRLPDCSSFDSKKFPVVSGTTMDNFVVYTHNGKNFCVKEKNK